MARYSVSLTDPRHIEWMERQHSPSKAIQALVERCLNTPVAKADIDLGAIRAIMETVLEERLAGLSVTGQTATQPTDIDPLGAFDDMAE